MGQFDDLIPQQGSVVPGMTQDEINEVRYLDPKLWSDSVNEKIGAYREQGGQYQPEPSQQTPRDLDELHRLLQQQATTPAPPPSPQQVSSGDQNDPSDLQGRDRAGGIITPDEMDRLWQSQQRYNEQQRARSMNEPSATQDFISQYSPSRALIAGNPTRASIQNATSGSFDDLIPQAQQQSIGTFDDLIPQGGGTAMVGPLQDVATQPQQPDYASQYGSSGPSTDEIAQFLQSPEGQVRSRPAQALVDYAKGMVPTDLNAAMRAANIPTDWRDPKQLAELAVPGLKPSLDIAEQAKGRYDQIQAAEQTPAWSQERWNAGIGTALDVAGLGEMIRGAARGTPEAPVRPASASEAAPKVETAPPPIERVSPETGDAFTVDPKTGETLTVNGKPLTAQATETTVPTESSPDEFRPQDEPRHTDQAVEQLAGQQQPAPEPGIGMGRSWEPTTVAEGGSGAASTKNAYTDEARARLGFPEATAEAARDFGTVWQEAEETSRRDPGAGPRLVEQINDGKTKAVSDHDNALLLREQIGAQAEHTDAVNAVNDAATDADRTAAKAQLVVARDRLQAVYDADKKSGRSLGQGLNARKMLAAEDYSLSQMEARKRAANDGKPLNAMQLKHVEELHNRISELSAKVDQLQQARSSRGGFSSLLREAQKESRAAATSGRKFTDFTGELADKARERIAQRRAEGRLYAGVDPVAVTDHVVIGADYIAKGVTKFADWSAAMVKELGDKIKPFLKDLWEKSRAYHDSTNKAYRTPQEKRLSNYKTRLAQDTVGVTAKIERGDFTKPTREPLVLDKAAFQMKANLERLKNEFERGVAKDAYGHTSKADKFWQHFVGIERAGKLSSPAVFEKLGLAAAVREVLAPVESAGGYVASKVFPRLAKGTRYGADLKTITRAEIKSKASLFTQGMKDAWENVKGKETDLEAMSDKYGRQPDFWYNRIGKIHAAVKAPIKRAEFTRSLELRMDAAVKAGEDINHPEVMDRLATESALDANRAIFQQNTVVSKFFSMLDKASPTGGRVARFLFPVVKIPVNLFKELVTYNVGAPVAAVKIGRAYWKGVETLEPAAREAIIRQLVKGSVGGAAILWGYYNSDKAHDFFKSMPSWFEHTPIAMAIHEGSIVKRLEQQGTGTHFRPTDAMKEAKYAAKTSIPFAYTITDATDTLDPQGWKKYLYSMIQSSTVPQAASWTAKEMDKPHPFSPTDKPRYRPPQNVTQAIEQGIPGMRERVPTKH